MWEQCVGCGEGLFAGDRFAVIAGALSLQPFPPHGSLTG